MQNLKGKTILITSGGTLEKWDEVRGHTNLARGTMGRYLAELALAQGAYVIYLHGYFAAAPDAQPNLQLQSFMGIESLAYEIRTLLRERPVDAVIMTAAVSDWVVDKMVDPHGNLITDTGKISSDTPPVVHFKKAPKVISQIKDWSPATTLVGFKLEHTTDESYLLGRARQRLEAWRADLCVANASSSLHTEITPHYIVSRDGDVVTCSSKQETAQMLLGKLEEVLN